MRNYKELLKKINTLVFDYDGVFTNSVVYIMNDGELLRTANTKDGYAVSQAIKHGFNIAIISGGKNDAVATRMKNLGVEQTYTHVQNKKECLLEFMSEKSIIPENVLYMGDDIPDIPAMKEVILPCCPDDAVEEVKSICHYISDNKG
ncbi:MAG: HAD hydrolase-like protein, partial [Bacteroidales bacterium]|nr:HAD hydrolase-like protein [Bacteroidales bacterium]